MGMQGSFDATQFKPVQFGDKHPLGKFAFQITNTSIVPTKDQSGGMFVVEFTSPQGVISNRYNLWNQSPKAVEIAQGQLSALCHATGVFRLDFTNDGAALRGARGMMDVALQKADEPDGYVEVKKVYDAAGNEPGRVPSNAPQPQAQPQQQQKVPTQQIQTWSQPASQSAPAPQQNPPANTWQQAPQPAPAQGEMTPNQPPWATGR